MGKDKEVKDSGLGQEEKASPEAVPETIPEVKPSKNPTINEMLMELSLVQARVSGIGQLSSELASRCVAAMEKIKTAGFLEAMSHFPEDDLAACYADHKEILKWAQQLEGGLNSYITKLNKFLSAPAAVKMREHRKSYAR